MTRALLLSASAVFVMAACAGDDSSAGPPPPPPPPPDPQVVGPAGGTVAAAGGNVLFQVPAGAVPADVRLTVEPIPDPVPSDKTVSGTTYQFGPTGTQFSAPVTVKLKYSPSALPPGTIPSELEVSRFENGAWVPVRRPVTVNPATNEVETSLLSFSRYAVTEKSCAARTLDLGSTRDGTLEATDCLFNAADGRRFDVWRFTVPTRQIVQLSTTSTVPGAQGIFTPGARTAWAAVARGSNPTITQRWLLDPGVYEAYIRGNDSASVGAYSSSLSTFAASFPAPAQGCGYVLMAEGSVQGRAESGDCAITTTFAPNPAQRSEQTWADNYVFRPQSSTSYTITVQSSSGGGYIALYVPVLQQAPLQIQGFGAGGQATISFTTPNPGDAFHYFEIAPTPHPSDRTQLAPLTYTFTIRRN
jgi:hypothetical protein